MEPPIVLTGARKTMVKVAALAIAVTGLSLASAPRAAQAAPLPIQTEATAPTGEMIEQAQYRRDRRHYRRHMRHRGHWHRHHRFGGPRHHHHRRHWNHRRW
ncbi:MULTISPECIES: hypothetical protein [Methylorubrum]|uniref:hypothetical protein n=1 Tax=Methylorubrum TaxID=2282523 RepID=UPI00209F6122|nr:MULTISPECIES: hypothetical protein [Methylorubrum]MCP1551191.1 arylamine N-acetyltransferase [Methylorubrum zatmanii]MCP1552194.1 arylamine N-acetyltransferase [Methylorubrum extorquens]MCP1581496.1 arylamine N-acetyltransferase [Methylorubrum extorquens]